MVAVLALGLPFYLAVFPNDLGVYLSAGHAVRHDLDIYSFQPWKYGFTYPPFPALIAIVPSLLSRWVAVAAMTLVSLYALYVLIERSAPGLVRRALRSWPALAALLALIACEPSRITLWNGQVNLILAALVLVDLQRPTTSPSRGVLIGLCAGVKLTPGLFVVYLLVRRQYRAAATAVGAFLASIGLSWIVLPRESREYWTDYLFNTGRIGDLGNNGNQSLRAVTARAISNVHVASVLWLALALGVLVIGLYVANALATRGDELLAIGVVGVLTCLLSPVAWTHHWVWCIPLLVGLYRYVAGRGRLARGAAYALALLFVIGTNKEPLKATYHWGLGRAVVENGYVLAAVATIICLLVSLRPSHTGRGPLRGWAAADRTVDTAQAE